VTGDRAEARRNRKLQLIVSNSFSGARGMTLLEKMELKLDNTMKARTQTIAERDRNVALDEADNGQAHWSDELENDHIDNLLRSEGEIKGMLAMLAIMRSTTMKTELQRSKLRIQYGVKPQSTEHD
jgi:hypothetical protein